LDAKNEIKEIVGLEDQFGIKNSIYWMQYSVEARGFGYGIRL